LGFIGELNRRTRTSFFVFIPPSFLIKEFETNRISKGLLLLSVSERELLRFSRKKIFLKKGNLFYLHLKVLLLNPMIFQVGEDGLKEDPQTYLKKEFLLERGFELCFKAIKAYNVSNILQCLVKLKGSLTLKGSSS